MDNIQIQSFVYNSFMYLPSPSADFGQGNPAYASQLTSQSWTALAGGPVHAPVTAARGIAPPFGQTSQVAYVAFGDGLLGTIGTNTESGGYVTQLPANMVPTGVGLTNGNEFALVTIWDTDGFHGEARGLRHRVGPRRRRRPRRPVQLRLPPAPPRLREHGRRHLDEAARPSSRCPG